MDFDKCFYCNNFFNEESYNTNFTQCYKCNKIICYKCEKYKNIRNKNIFYIRKMRILNILCLECFEKIIYYESF
jgi:hypothetical protein